MIVAVITAATTTTMIILIQTMMIKTINKNKSQNVIANNKTEEGKGGGAVREKNMTKGKRGRMGKREKRGSNTSIMMMATTHEVPLTATLASSFASSSRQLPSLSFTTWEFLRVSVLGVLVSVLSFSWWQDLIIQCQS